MNIQKALEIRRSILKRDSLKIDTLTMDEVIEYLYYWSEELHLSNGNGKVLGYSSDRFVTITIEEYENLLDAVAEMTYHG